ncbi:MAG TPA: hypothetical protein VG916_09990 [Gemmatimonadaceae bacterium]|nr:hypothetical protein [Gemmatimonadaceae bacterium]
MMHDNLDPELTGGTEPAANRDEPAADREVPVAAHTPTVIHAWLDGERVDESALHAAGGYELWRQVQAETDRRRRMRTPTPIAGAIMEAIRKDA